ncbi:MAG: DUF1015 domain-containing protein [Kosmotoga sp.]|nr:MAG: DUF1015 domain-containing protein [Kosmotoga sp.]
MAILKPFKAVRPRKELVKKVQCPPYDVVSFEEAADYGKHHESFMHVIRAEIDLPEDTPHYGKTVYKKAKENLEKLVKDNILIQDEKPSFYLYKQRMNDHEQIGLVACASVDEYQQNKIKKHELTRKEKEDDRANHVYTVGANTGPVFLTFESQEATEELFRKLVNELEPVYEFVDENSVQHTVYVINSGEMIKEISDAFSNIPVLYIADGHHRAASASRVREKMKEENKHHSGDEEYNYFLSVIFPHNHLNVLDYNRVVKDLNGLSKKDFLKSIENKFTIEEADETPYAPKNKHEFGMYIDNHWYVIKPKDGTFNENDPVKSLDVAILQNNLLEPVLGIKNPRSDSRIDFIGGIRGLKELETRVTNGWAVAFSMFPTSIEELMKVADEGLVMPPKSTWFEPKLRSGLFVHLLK